MVLSREEASRLIESARTLKHRTAVSVAYGAGLRVSEVCALKVGDIGENPAGDVGTRHSIGFNHYDSELRLQL